ncbi:DUF2779 domain-containing protein [Mesoplasma corruscae]|uniref:DUF2779 domain-containing protein n=1 Tax=Mesoplasma corruscae TaxID=216874 RepID=A0A2S5RG27_9MOLU|nr:DUF2779 domain-containing protein [Mesoplasma corruscae]PPE06247.1 hypothetical protein MCORR_v1c05510 [Mesoplasma corruscae]
MIKLKTPVNKETFKLALSECIKKAWVWDNKNNFEYAVNLYKSKQLTFDVGALLEDQEEFDESAVAIDLFEAYANVDKLPPLEAQEFLSAWNQAWENEEGFDIDSFKGESIEDGLAFGHKVQEYFDMLNIFENKTYQTNFKTLNLSDLNFANSLDATQKALLDDKVKYIYEAGFSYNNEMLKTKCDVIKIKPNKHVEIYEAKATSKVKKEHFFDIVYQAYILEKLGFIVDNIFIVHVNGNYVRGWDYNKIHDNQSFGDFAKLVHSSLPPIKYDEIKEMVNSDFVVLSDNELSDLDLQALVFIDELTWGTKSTRKTLFEDYKTFKSTFDLDVIFSTISNFLTIDSNSEEALEMLSNLTCQVKIEKSRSGIFNYAGGNKAYNSCFHAMKWFDKYTPGFWNITKLAKKNKSYIINNSKSPYFKDYETLSDHSIPLNKKRVSFLETNQKALRMFEVYKAQKEHPNDINKWKIIDPNNIDLIKGLLGNYLHTPIYMYDFETSKWAIPRFNKTNSYYQVPFQYSIDVITNDKFDYNDSTTMPHYDFLSNEVNVDPRPKFIENFIKDSFKHGPGVYVAYNESFEKGVLRKLALLYPEFAKPLLYIVEHTIDLMDFFYGSDKENRPYFLIYHPNFLGSYSIKKTQPSLDANFSYNDLVINKGDKASETFRNFVDKRIPIDAWNISIKEGMLKYCNRDTLAMVVILKRIKELMGNIYE